MNACRRSLFVTLALCLTASAAFAQGRLDRIEIVLKDVDSHEDFGAIQPGGTAQITPGGHVRLILSAIYANGKTIYPVTTFSDRGRGGVNITRANPQNAAADLDVSKATGGTEEIGYTIVDSRIPQQWRRGSFFVRVVDRRGGNSSSTGGWQRYDRYGREGRWRDGQWRGRRDNGNFGWYNGSGSTRAREMTRILYQAILLRDPDPGAAGTVQSIDRGGFDAVVRAAEGIAASDESRRRIYDNRDVTNERRLDALYRYLLGLDPQDVDRATRNDDLRRLDAGRVADLVSDMVRSQRFRAQFEDYRRY